MIENLLALNPIDLIGILLIWFIVIPFVLLAILTVWVFKNAKKNELNAVVWVLIVWIIPFFFGFIVYLIVRNRNIANAS
ncbi:MAG: hypothetical protein V3V33_00210 [Candidatus Lokiarchaeia archaeon]